MCLDMLCSPGTGSVWLNVAEIDRGLMRVTKRGANLIAEQRFCLHGSHCQLVLVQLLSPFRNQCLLEAGLDKLWCLLCQLSFPCWMPFEHRAS